MTGEEIVALNKRHTLYEWSAQSHVDPIPVAGAKGVHFWTPEGKRFIDFNSQLMCTNIGHGHPKVIEAIRVQAEQLAYVNPFMATEARGRLGAKLAELCPGDIDVFFFTNGGAEANENAIRLARLVTGRHKILARYRSYHGGTAGSLTLTGDPRRWASEPGIPGVVRVPHPYHGVQRGSDTTADALTQLEEIIMLEGPQTIAAFIVETVTGTNGVLPPPPGYLEGVRALCDRHGILLICDEVMSGFGRTGKWFAVEHYGVVPDMITMAKGLTSAYVPLGALGIRRGLADHFQQKVFYGGLTYNSHPLGCATALATIQVYEEEGLIDRAREMGDLMRLLHEEMQAKHPCVGEFRSIGLFGIVELVRDRTTREALAPFNGTSPEMQILAKHFREEGLYTFVRWNNFFTNPPLVITEAEMREAFAIIDRGLTKVDAALGHHVGRDLVIVGAGPAGLATAIAARHQGVDALVIDQGTVADGIRRFPTHMTFFTTPPLLEIGGLPFTTPHEKPSRLEAWRYYRRAAELSQVAMVLRERVTAVEPDTHNGEPVLVVTSVDAGGVSRARAGRAVALAMGYYDQPNHLGVPGEDRPHVSHYYTEAAPFYRQRVVVVGGKNSACDTALDLYRGGAQVTLVHRRAALGEWVKYWVRPDIENRIAEGAISAHFESDLVEIRAREVVVRHRVTGEAHAIGAEAVFLMTGYQADHAFLERCGVRLHPETRVPEHDPGTNETNVPGLYIAGGQLAGVRTGSVFIENGRLHGEVIARAVAARLSGRA